MNNASRLISTHTAAQQLGVSITHLCKLIHMGHIEAFNLGSRKMPRYYISQVEIKKYIEKANNN